jgi:hypothetical protein
MAEAMQRVHLVANLLTFHTLVTITNALRQVLQEYNLLITNLLIFKN